jgi:hypothetical protein
MCRIITLGKRVPPHNTFQTNTFFDVGSAKFEHLVFLLEMLPFKVRVNLFVKKNPLHMPHVCKFTIDQSK